MNQVLRNNIGAKVLQNKADNKITIGFAFFFILSMFIVGCLSFATGFWFKGYINKNNNVAIHQNNKVKPSHSKTYEVSLGNFHDKSDASDFASKFPYLHNVIMKTASGYVVKLKDKFTLNEALSIADSIQSEYKIIPTLLERQRDA